MKMMNTELEFVSFDAQDVIATSGGLTDYYGILSSNTGIISKDGFASTTWKLDDDYISISSSLTQNYNFNLGTTSTLQPKTEYVLTGVIISPRGTAFFSYTEKSEVNLAPGAKNLYDSNSKPTIKSILDWLVTNQSLLQ